MFLLIDNYDSFTYNLVQAFQTLGKDPLVLYNDDPRVLELATDPALEMVCLSPGPSHPANSGYCLEFLKRLPHNVPVLGVCLGHQILGLLAGAEVKRAPQVMHGKTSDIVHDGTGLFLGVPNPMRAGRYHSLVVGESNAFEVTARGPEGEVMALRYRDRPWAGVQFHPESILTEGGEQLLANFPSALLPDARIQVGMKSVLNTLAEGKDLSAAQASAAFEALMDGKLPLVQAGSFLMGLRIKGTTPVELAQAARAALGRAVRLPAIEGDVFDVVGTGGDSHDSFNCSTATALTVAGLGYRVVKHGNRAITSKCGSADVLERLGVPLDLAPEKVPGYLAEHNFAFLFAPRYHPAFRNLEPIRKDLAIRSVFNLLGPLINPARPARTLIGAASRELVPLMAATLKEANVRSGAVVCGAGGYDEVSTLGPSEITFVRDGVLSESVLDPLDFGFARGREEDLKVHSPEEAERVLRELLKGRGPEPMRDMLALNVGVALYLLNDSQLELRTCMAKAREAVAAGAGSRILAGL
ncbi:MAG: anthranilate phosphoribosyltransferase [Kiritimatiellia bacterium]